MRKICKEKEKLERFELPREEAVKLMQEREEPYKVANSPTCAQVRIWTPPAVSRATASS